MKRRDFIKNSIITTCGLGILGNCGVDAKLFEKQDDLEKKLKELGLWENEIYKSKEDLPKKIRLEACTLCQLNCPECGFKKYPKIAEEGLGFGYLKFKDFKNLVDDNPQIEEIELSHLGEIFLNPELLDIIRYGYEKNIILKAENGVNLNTLSDDLAEALVKYKFRKLVISIDGATPKVYKIYRRNGNLNDVIANIKKIQYYQKKYNSEYPHMYYKFIVFGHNEHEIPKAKELANELGIPIFFERNHTPEYSPIHNIDFVERETGLIYRTESRNADDVTNYEHGVVDYLRCNQLWQDPQINWDGKLLGCCMVWTKNNFGGNVFKEGLLKTLNSSKFMYTKNMLTQGIEPLHNMPCMECSVYQEIRESNCRVKKPDI